MPLLDVTSPTLTPEQLAAKRAAEVRRKASVLTTSTTYSFNALLTSLTSSFGVLWDDENPQEILDALGTAGPELFQLSSLTLQFLGAVTDVSAMGEHNRAVKEKLTGLAAKVKPFTIVNGKIHLTS
jgi:hypothetical protein